MKSTLAVLALLVATPAWGLTITLDGTLGEWTGPGVLDLGTRAAPDSGNYRLLVTWDASNLYVGMDRNSSDRYLGDTGWDNDSFFFAIDHAAGGASSDGYGSMNFGGSDKPDRIYYYAGGAGWYENSSWNGSGWDWNGWTDAGTYYGHQEANPDDELTIPLSAIGGSEQITIWAWMTREENHSYVEASWPDGATGGGPTFGAGIAIPEPATLALLALGGFGLLRRRSA